MSDDAKNNDADDAKADDAKAEEPKADDAKAEEPKAEEKAEEPKAEEKAEEPKAEEKAEEPKAEAKDVVAEAKAEVAEAAEPKAEEKAEEPKAEEKAEEPKAEEPKAEEKAEEPKAEEPAAEAAPEEPAAEAASEEGDAVGAPVSDAEQKHLGTLVEFETEDALMTACATVRDAGYTRWDAHTPYPVHGLDAAMGIKPTILPWIVFIGGVTGCAAGLILQFYTNGIELPFSLQGTPLDPFLPSGYKFVTSGKPIFSVPANIPVVFELTILLSAFGAFFGMWGLNKLPHFNHPVFASTRFRRATCDRFFISFETADPQYDADKTRVFAETLGGSHVEGLMGAEE